MNKVTKLLVAAWLVGSLIYACSPGPSHLLHNKTMWELREQLVFLTGVWAMSFMVLCVVVSARFEIVNHPANLADVCRQNNVNLIHIDTHQERLSPEALMATCRDPKRMSVWFCGPGEMRKSLQKMLQRSELPKGRFHYDSFLMR